MVKSNLKNLLKKSIDSQMSSPRIKGEKKIIFLQKFKKNNILFPKSITIAIFASLVIVIQVTKMNSSIFSASKKNFTPSNEIRILIENEISESIQDDLSDNIDSSELDEVVI